MSDWRAPLRVLRARMMGKNKHYRWQREQLWRRDPRCCYCSCVTVLPPADRPMHRKFFPNNEATIEHLDSRLSPERGRHAGEFRRAIACRRCNHARAAAEVAALPLQTKWEASGALAYIARLSGALNEVDEGFRR